MSTREDDEKRLVSEIEKNRGSGAVSFATLRTDDRVLARITDGIYRQPASALRELISNAYDADSTTVVIHTDAPRFDQITIRDDGNGMDVVSLARLIHHIGGSVKRRAGGAQLGITNKSDASLSPKGRRLIGKIGIGLFSVSQLTRHFQIVTKVRGKDYRLVAEVILKTYAEDARPTVHAKGAPGEVSVETGTVRIVSVPAADRNAHGTEVILLDLRPQAREVLESAGIWRLVTAQAPADGLRAQLREPAYHIGQVDRSSNTIVREPRLPWEVTDSPDDRFRKLYQSIIDEVGTWEQNPRLETTLDNYLRMLWTLSLSAPIDYIQTHPFDLRGEEAPRTYSLHAGSPGQAGELRLGTEGTPRKRLALRAPERGDSPLPFRVFVDDIQLLRPIRFTDLPQTTQALKAPVLFIGKAKPDLSGISDEERGGDLEFEAYFLWAPKVVPKENNGLLIRIADASGTLFDETFLKYQVSELTRLRQLTAEVFVLKGLDAALNIDRESFNFAHPHVQYLMRWVHDALRQIMNSLKHQAKTTRMENGERATEGTTRRLEAIVNEEASLVHGDTQAEAADIAMCFTGDTDLARERREGRIALDGVRIFEPAPKSKRCGERTERHDRLFRRQIEAVAQVLSAYGLLEDLTYKEQEDLLRAIVAIFSVGKEK